jgi:hypothetical protein
MSIAMTDTDGLILIVALRLVPVHRWRHPCMMELNPKV